MLRGLVGTFYDTVSSGNRRFKNESTANKQLFQSSLRLQDNLTFAHIDIETTETSFQLH